MLWVNDANGVESERMYKPIPFFLSSRGYGMFVHTRAPATFDFGATFHGSNALLLGDDELDLFVFLGTPKEVLDEYTKLTGKAPMPPLWSFGLWMSRITYKSEERDARRRGQAAREQDPLRRDPPRHRLVRDRLALRLQVLEDALRRSGEDDRRPEEGRLPHLALAAAVLRAEEPAVPGDREKGLVVRDGKGNLPYEDAVLDFSNPDDREVVSGQARRRC